MKTLILVAFFTLKPLDKERSGLYKITIKTEHTCGGLPKVYTYFARLKIVGDCFENKCNISTSKYRQSALVADGEGGLLFATYDGMRSIEYIDQDGNNTTVMPNNIYSIGFDHAKINGVAITDYVGGCAVVYAVNGVKQW